MTEARSSNPPDVGIVVLNYNNYEDTKKCLASLRKLNYPNFEVLLVDNGSADSSSRRLAKEFPEAILTETGKNLGYTGGNNLGIKEALARGADIILALNNDVVVVTPGLLNHIVEVMVGNPRVGIVGPRVRDYADPSRRSDIYDRSRFYRLIDFFCLRPRKRLCVSPCGLRMNSVDRVSGGAIAFSRQFLEEVGLFDERFFMYCEEIDLAFRGILAGYDVIHIDDDRVQILHKTKRTNVPPWVWYYISRNMFLLARKLFRGFKKYFIFLLYSMVIWKRALSLSLHRDARGARGCLVGWWDGLLGRTGMRTGEI